MFFLASGYYDRSWEAVEPELKLAFTGFFENTRKFRKKTRIIIQDPPKKFFRLKIIEDPEVFYCGGRFSYQRKEKMGYDVAKL